MIIAFPSFLLIKETFLTVTIIEQCNKKYVVICMLFLVMSLGVATIQSTLWWGLHYITPSPYIPSWVQCRKFLALWHIAMIKGGFQLTTLLLISTSLLYRSLSLRWRGETHMIWMLLHISSHLPLMITANMPITFCLPFDIASHVPLPLPLAFCLNILFQ